MSWRSSTLRTPEAELPDPDATGAGVGTASVIVSGVRRTFAGAPSVDALDGVDVEVPAGRLTSILGPSGSGKTTLLRVLAGTERADEGSVRVQGLLCDGAGAAGAGRRVHVAPERRRVGLVPQEGALFPHLDVAGNVGFGLHRMARPQRRARVTELLELVGLAGLEHRRVHELSGGQQQRVALARALAPEPQVVLLDEPFSALDASLRADLRVEVADLLRSTGTTAVLVTHDQAEAMSVADHMAVMRAGRIVQQGAPQELYRRPVDLWVAGFLGEAVVLDGVLIDVRPDGVGRARCVLGDVPVELPDAPQPSLGPVRVFCRPEQIWCSGGPRRNRVAARPELGRADRGATAVRATVLEASSVGPDLRLRLVVGSDEVLARWPSSMASVSVGDVVELELLGAAVAYGAPS